MLAEQMVGSLGLSILLFVPCSRPPHKDEAQITPVGDRVEMIRLAIEGNPKFELSTIECDDPGLSYTYKTFEILRDRYGPEAELFYVVGSDVLDGLDKFKRFERLFELCQIAAAVREGVPWDAASALAGGLASRYGAKIRLVPSTRVDVSSTGLRERVARRESIRYLVPDAVAAYIASRRLYAGGLQPPAGQPSGRSPAEVPTSLHTERSLSEAPTPTPTSLLTERSPAEIPAPARLPSKRSPAEAPAPARLPDGLIAEISEALRAELSEKRYSHSLRVMETAGRLARLHGLDARKAELAGLMHDFARDMVPGVLFDACARAGIAVSELERRQPELLHGSVAAEIARARFGVSDEDTLNAIRHHTLGRPGMSSLEMALLVADAVEPGRRHDGADAARALADTDLAGAALAVLGSQIAYVLSTGRMLDPATVRTRNWLLGRKGCND